MGAYFFTSYLQPIIIVHPPPPPHLLENLNLRVPARNNWILFKVYCTSRNIISIILVFFVLRTVHFEIKLYNNVIHIFLFISLFTSALNVSGFLLAHLQRHVYTFGRGSSLRGMVSGRNGYESRCKCPVDDTCISDGEASRTASRHSLFNSTHFSWPLQDVISPALPCHIASECDQI
jgi:hypothetical protein